MEKRPYFLFDKAFIFDSYSCRLNKGTHRAVNRLQKFARKVGKNNTKTCFTLKCDIRKFFDSIDQDILISLIKKRIKDVNAIWLIEKIIKSFWKKSGRGIPLGNVTSQLFSNVYFDKLDQFIKHKLRIKYYIRYCDDFVILEDSEKYLEDILSNISDFLKENLKLFLHLDKILIRRYHQGIDFLGYISFPYYRILRAETKIRMFRRISQKIKELRQSKISEESFNQIIQSYLGILKHCAGYQLSNNLKKFLIYDNHQRPKRY